MSTRHLLDPSLHAFVDAWGTLELRDDVIATVRARPQPPLADAGAVGVTRTAVTIPREDGGAVRALLYRREADPARAGYVHLHGGGYLFGEPKGSDARNVDTAATLGVTVLSVDYRLAPEEPVPAGLDDAFAALAWLHGEAERLGIDPARIAVGGESAGGGLAAALALAARDDDRYPIAHAHLTYPMLDDRTGTDAVPGDPTTGEFVWTRASNRFAWAHYLGDAEPRAPWVPARVDDLAGFPPTWMMTAALDLFREENVDFAQRLMNAGVATELVVYAGACHGFQLAPGSTLGVRYARDHRDALARGLGLREPR
jgi:acetyl esterase/lipase